MKFDYIIMNPPYNGNLHLKILQEVIKYSDNVINLSPVRWLQDPLANYKSTSVLKQYNKLLANIKNIEVIPAAVARKIFNAGMVMDLGIYETGKSQQPFTNLAFNDNKKETIFNKVFLDYSNKLSDKIEIEKIDGIRVKLRFILPSGDTRSIYTAKCGITQIEEPIINGKLINGKEWQSLDAQLKDKKNIPMSIKFRSIIEAKNFIKSFYTDFMTYIYYLMFPDQHVYFWAIPDMSDQINPRTGLKGYEGEWLDEDFYKFFNLTTDEIKIIEDTMEKYK